MAILIRLSLILFPLLSFSTAIEVAVVYSINQTNDTTFQLSKHTLTDWAPDSPEYTFYADSIIEFNLCNDDPNRVNIWTNRGTISASFFYYDILLDIDDRMLELGKVYKLKNNCWSTIYQKTLNDNQSIYIDDEPINLTIEDSIVDFSFSNYNQIIISSFEDSTQTFYNYFNNKIDTLLTFSSPSPFNEILTLTSNNWVGLSYQNDKTIIYNSINQKLDTLNKKLRSPIIAPTNWYGSDTLFFFDNNNLFSYNIDNSHLGSSSFLVDKIINTSFITGDFMNEYIPLTRTFTVHKGDSLYVSIHNPDNTILSLGSKDSTWAIATYDVIGGLKDEGSSKKQNVYPNPTTNTITFSNINKTIQGYEIYNSLGLLLREQNTSGQSIDVSDLTEGQYIINIITLDEEYKSTFIKL